MKGTMHTLLMITKYEDILEELKIQSSQLYRITDLLGNNN
jgi:DNA-directed RNA polymerase subunit H (RpoH/RPB5)